MNRNTVLCAVAALMLPSVVHAHPLPTGGHGRASLACRPPDHVATLAVAMVALLLGLGSLAARR